GLNLSTSVTVSFIPSVATRGNLSLTYADVLGSNALFLASTAGVTSGANVSSNISNISQILRMNGSVRLGTANMYPYNANNFHITTVTTFQARTSNCSILLGHTWGDLTDSHAAPLSNNFRNLLKCNCHMLDTTGLNAYAKELNDHRNILANNTIFEPSLSVGGNTGRIVYGLMWNKNNPTILNIYVKYRVSIEGLQGATLTESSTGNLTWRDTQMIRNTLFAFSGGAFSVPYTNYAGLLYYEAQINHDVSLAQFHSHVDAIATSVNL
ncbi:MAG: hypothetical protein ACRC80_37695, partial [Waterburya sp.]